MNVGIQAKKAARTSPYATAYSNVVSYSSTACVRQQRRHNDAAARATRAVAVVLVEYARTPATRHMPHVKRDSAVWNTVMPRPATEWVVVGAWWEAGRWAKMKMLERDRCVWAWWRGGPGQSLLPFLLWAAGGRQGAGQCGSVRCAVGSVLSR